MIGVEYQGTSGVGEGIFEAGSYLSWEGSSKASSGFSPQEPQAQALLDTVDLGFKVWGLGARV